MSAQERLAGMRGSEALAQEDTELAQAAEDLGGILREYGLDPFPTRFIMVPSTLMHEMAAYMVPGAFHHWTRGRDFYREQTMQRHNVARVYEMVVNADPSIAFIQETNRPIEDKLVMAHVFGHTDFFKHNAAFRGTDHDYPNTAYLQAQRIEQYESTQGIGAEAVEQLLDGALSVEWNIEPVADSRKWESRQAYLEAGRREFETRQRIRQYPTSEYDDLFDIGIKREEPKKEKPPFPVGEEGNILLFIALHSPELEDWQRDILRIVHDEKQYIRPQGLTKIMNEGWAAYWHVQALREYGERGGLTPAEEFEWPQVHSQIMTPNPAGINPYYVGYYMWEDIRRRFEGRPLDSGEREYNWDGDEMDPKYYEGSDLFNPLLVREMVPSDQAFFRNYLTPELMDRLQLYTYEFDGNNWVRREKNSQVDRDTLIARYTNMGQPVIRIPEGGGDYNGNSELYMMHKFEGEGLELDTAKKTLQYIQKLWGRTVHLEAVEQAYEDKTADFEGYPVVRREFKTRRVLLTCKDGEVEVKILEEIESRNVDEAMAL